MKAEKAREMFTSLPGRRFILETTRQNGIWHTTLLVEDDGNRVETGFSAESSSKREAAKALREKMRRSSELAPAHLSTPSLPQRSIPRPNMETKAEQAQIWVPTSRAGPPIPAPSQRGTRQQYSSQYSSPPAAPSSRYLEPPVTPWGQSLAQSYSKPNQTQQDGSTRSQNKLPPQHAPSQAGIGYVQPKGPQEHLRPHPQLQSRHAQPYTETKARHQQDRGNTLGRKSSTPLPPQRNLRQPYADIRTQHQQSRALPFREAPRPNPRRRESQIVRPPTAQQQTSIPPEHVAPQPYTDSLADHEYENSRPGRACQRDEMMSGALHPESGPIDGQTARDNSDQRLSSSYSSSSPRTASYQNSDSNYAANSSRRSVPSDKAEFIERFFSIVKHEILSK